MNASEYAPLARRTLKMMPDFRQHMIHMGLGIAGEFGELIDAVKKVHVYGKPYDHTNAVEESGDVMWYVANLLPELLVDPAYMQRGFDRGYEQGLALQAQVPIWESCNMGDMLLGLNQTVAAKAHELGRLNGAEVPGSAFAVSIIEVFAGNVGVLNGLLGVDAGDAMQRNIAKLRARYPDKYSDGAALNRDLGAERSVLEGKEG